MRVLVVEDDSPVAGLLGHFLTSRGHEPRLVSNADAAFEALAGGGVDLILLDHALPGMTGLEFLRRAPARAAGIPVLALSGAATRDDVRAYLEAGALDFLAKPVSLGLLERAITAAEVQIARRVRIRGLPESAPARVLRPHPAMVVLVSEYGRPDWSGTAVSLSTAELKVRPAATVEPGPTVLLSFSPPDAGLALQLFARRARKDPDGYAYRFFNLTAAEFDRVRRLVDRLSAEPA